MKKRQIILAAVGLLLLSRCSSISGKSTDTEQTQILEKQKTEETAESSDNKEDREATAVISKPNEDEITTVGREYLHQNINEFKGKWVRTAGEITAVVTFDDGATTVNFTGKSELRELRFYLMDDQTYSLLQEGDYVTIVGKAEGGILGQSLIYNSYIENTGEEARLLDEELTAEYVAEMSDDAPILGTSETDRSEAIVLTAYEAYQQLQDNQVACKTKYDGKLIAMTGTIEDIGTNVLGQEYITFETGERYSLSTVQCFFKNDQLEYVSSLKKGQTITLYGYGNIGSMSFKMGSCQP